MARSSSHGTRVRKTVFDNGLTLVSESTPHFYGVSMGIWIKIGTRSEESREAGISHYLEHMLFKGTESRNALDLVKEIEAVGGDFNAFTARENTCFQVLIPSEFVDVGGEILTDVLLRSTFDSGEFERERKVILQEIAMVEDGLEELAFDLLYEKMFPGHGLGHPILGTPKTIRKMARKDLVGYFRKNYVPSQTVVAVSGDISHERLKKVFKDLTRRHWAHRVEGAKVSRRGRRAPSVVPHAHWVSRSSEQSHILLACEAFQAGSKFRFAALLLNHALGGGMSSLLFQKIREEHGLAYSVYSYLSPYWDTGVFSIYAGTSPNKVGQCLKLVDQITDRLTEIEFTHKELEEVKSNLKGNIALAFDDVESRMSSLAKSEIYFGTQVPLRESFKILDQVTPREVREVARVLFRHKKRVALGVGPRPNSTTLKALKNWAQKN